MYKIIQELEADASRLAKEAILKREADAGYTELYAGVHLALNNYIIQHYSDLVKRSFTRIKH